MASEREKAKGAVVKSDDEDAELEAALASAAKHQLDLKKEDNRHREEMNKMSLGFSANYGIRVVVRLLPNAA